MNKRLLAALTALAALIPASALPTDTIASRGDAPISATMTARDTGSAQWFFAMAPDDVLPLLPVNTRLDMLDYYNSGLARPSRNAAGGQAMVTDSDARSLRFQLGDSTTCEIGVFAAGRDTVVALIETIRFPMPDSRIEWFDARWNPIKAPVAEPRLADWLTRDGRRHRAEVESALPFITAEATTDPADGLILWRRTIDSYFLLSERPEALGLLAPSITQRVQIKPRK